MKSYLVQFKNNTIGFIYKVLYKINPRYAAGLMYYQAFHKRMNLDNPQTLIEKTNWMQFNTDTSLWTQCADKYRIREYVAEKGLEEHLPKLYGHWKDPGMIDFYILPDEFVLKSNNGCGTVKIVRDKSQLDIRETRKMMKGWLKPYGYVGGQSHYLRIDPCIIAEELLHQDEKEKAFSPTSLVDYKMWCINGEPESVWVAYNRHNVFMVNMALYDKDWNPIPQYLRDTAQETFRSDVAIPKPACFEEMKEIARKLAAPFPQLRLDFYVIKDKPYIGEMTFTSGYGFYTDDYYDYLGKKVDLSGVKRNNKQ